MDKGRIGRAAFNVHIAMLMNFMFQHGVSQSIAQTPVRLKIVSLLQLKL